MSCTAIPPSTLASLALVPNGVRAAFLVRHAERPEIPLGSFGLCVDITADGVRHAEELGQQLRGRPRHRLVASPLPRCLNTARAIARGAGWTAVPTSDIRLASPFISDNKVAVVTYARYGLAPTVMHQLEDDQPPPGFRATREGMKTMLETVIAPAHADAGLDVFVTHDANIAVAAGYLVGTVVDDDNWPSFLEGMFFWRREQGLGLAWRGEVFAIASPLIDKMARSSAVAVDL